LIFGTLSAVATALWYEDDACTGLCTLGALGLGGFFTSAFVAALILLVGVLCTFVHLVGISRLSERSQLGYRLNLDTAVVAVIVLFVAGWVAFTLIDPLGAV
jgi:hypothetical protein